MGTSALSPASQLALLPAAERAAFLATLAPEEAAALAEDWDFWARPSQRPPPGDWHVWLILAGRGWGKSRVGAEQVLRWARTPHQRIALVAETAADVRDVVVEGESGILACAAPGGVPRYEPSKRRLTWPNGTIATTYSGDAPDQLRGPQHHFAYCDEIAKYQYAQAAWDNLALGLRLGTHPQVIATTTPRPIPLLRHLLADPGTVVTRGATYENTVNLAPAFRQRILARYEGTRLGRQEIYAELLDDTPGALWNRTLLEQTRVRQAPPLRRIVVGLDPGGEAGIVVAGLGEDGHGYVLEDLSVSGSPATWASQAVTGYYKYHANLVAAEANHGGDMVLTTLRTTDAKVATKKLWASQGKYARAEPVSSLYEQQRVHHVGMFGPLEDELTTWVPGEGRPSPNRLDACLVAGTLITTSHGAMPIEQVTTREQVWTRAGWCPVLASGMTNPAAPVMTVECADGAQLTGTRAHPVFVVGKGFCALDSLGWGDRLMRGNDVVRRYARGVAPVYNLTVASQPEYYANGLLVHNCVWALTDLMLGAVPKSAGTWGETIR